MRRIWKEQALRYWWLLVLWEAAVVAALVTGAMPLWLLILQAPLLWTFLTWPSLYGVHRAARKLLPYPDVTGKRVRLIYDPALADAESMARHLEAWEETAEELEDRFQIQFSGVITVVVVRGVRQVSELCRGEASGIASSRVNGIMAAWEAMQPSVCARELMLHELGHLVSLQWGSAAPKFKSEGFCLWLQQTQAGRPIELYALACLVGGPSMPMSWLLDDRAFRLDSEASYALAGGFTTYLIRKYGWETYHSFYRRAERRTYEEAFRTCFGRGLDEADAEWRAELLARRADFEPELTWQVHRRRASTWLSSFSYGAALSEYEALRDGGAATTNDLQEGAWCHVYFGRYAVAAEWFRAAAEADEPQWTSRAAAWLSAGAMHDLLGEREQALQAYYDCLRHPDEEVLDGASAHDRARYRQEHPYTLADLREQTR